MSTPSCFTYIIGLSRTNCACFEYPADAAISDSNLWLDELEPLNSTLVKGRGDYEKGGLADLMYNAREQAILAFNSDIVKELLKNNEFNKSFYTGGIGRACYTNDLTINDTYAGLRMLCSCVKDGYIHITNIRTIFSTTGTIDLMVWNNLGELINTFTLNVTVGTYEDNAIDLSLPMYSDYIDNLEYYFIYDATGQIPKNISLNCLCGGWVPDSPCFNSCNKGWEQWVMIGGMTRDDLNFSDCPLSYPCNQYTNGLLLNVEFKCDVWKLICRDQLDFTYDNFTFKYAEVVRLKGGELLTTSLLGSPEINRYTTMNRETLASARSLFIEQYAEKMQWLGENIDVTKNDCLNCKEPTGIRKQTIWL